MVFQFMLKEYEKLYGKFDMHYQAVEKSINFYFALIGAVISLNGLVYNKLGNLNIYGLSGLQILFNLIICVLGTLIFFKVIEHRILIIAYVKSLNLNRKWFLDNSEDQKLSEYFYFKADVNSPRFYKRFRHFYWEATGLATINSIFCSFFLINVLKRVFNWQSSNALLINTLLTLGISLATIILHLLYYKVRGNQEEKKVSESIKKLV